MTDCKDKWKCCIKEPSELGKKVLCERNGDFYVCMRLEEYYIPMPFVDHYFSIDLCKPNKWCEIDFMEPYKGYMYVCPDGNIDNKMTLQEAKEKHPEIYYRFAETVIKSIGTLKKND